MSMLYLMDCLHYTVRVKPWASYTLDLVTKLLTHGAVVDLEDNEGWSALNYVMSAEPFQPHVAQLVLDCSKKGINRIDENYYNYLWSTYTLESIKFLVENGIDINHVANDETYLDNVYRDNVDSVRIEYLRSVGASYSRNYNII